MNKDLFENFIIDNIPSGLFVIENDKIVYWNNEMEKITGIKKSNILNSNLDKINFYKEEFNDEKLELSKCLIANKELKNTVFVKNKNNYKQVLFHSKSIEKQNTFIVMVSDISNTSVCNILSEYKKIEKHNHFQNLIGKDKKMQEIFNMINLASETSSNVLISGESGTGKELIAKAIHDLSDRKNEPFITVNCSSLSETLLESELFGHIKGAFTGAYQDKIGKFESSHEGSIFLDEIGDISPLIQIKLLRVIQEKTITKVGDNKEIKVDMRIIAATNKDLRKLVSMGKFREDLFYRLKVFPINTIALRDIRNDIPLLCEHFVGKFNKEMNKKIKGFTDDALRLIMDYCWPGNIRELENSIEHAFVICKNDFIDIFDLPQELRVVSYRQGICKDLSSFEDNFYFRVPTNVNQGSNSNRHIKRSRNSISKDKLVELLDSNNWNKTETARQLGISRVGLWKKIKNFGIE